MELSTITFTTEGSTVGKPVKIPITNNMNVVYALLHTHQVDFNETDRYWFIQPILCNEFILHLQRKTKQNKPNEI